MNLHNLDLNNNKLKKENENNLAETLLDMLKSFLDKSNTIKDGSIFVITDIIDEKLTLVDVDNGNEFNIYISTCKEDSKRLNNLGIVSNIYELSKRDFHSLDLGSNLIFKNGSYSIYNDEINITNSEVSAKLEDMYFSLKQEEGQVYVVDKISDEKIYLTTRDGQGYFYIYKDLYPDFKVGDLIKKQNGKYLTFEK